MVVQLYCLVCGTPTTTLCSSCKTGSYCSKEHQKQDWKSHKEYCLHIKSAENAYDAILFHTNETKPRLIKVPWKMGANDEDDEYSIPWEDVDKRIWFKYPDSSKRSIEFNRMGIDGPPLGYGLCFTYDDNAFINGSPFNRCVAAATGGKAGHPWSGNIVGLRLKHDPGVYGYRMGSMEFYADVDMEKDLKAFVKYFEDYGTRTR